VTKPKLKRRRDLTNSQGDTVCKDDTPTTGIVIKQKPGERKEVAEARAILRPTVQAAITLQGFSDAFGDVELQGLVVALTEQTKATNGGDSGRAKAMLTTQAHTLDALFHTLARRAGRNMGEYTGAANIYMKLALRAQSQCRATWEAVSAIQHPPLANYVGQANIAHGHQQVNNAVADNKPSHTRKKKKPENELLEEKHGSEWLDKGAATTTSGNDPEMETVGAINRPENSER